MGLTCTDRRHTPPTKNFLGGGVAPTSLVGNRVRLGRKISEAGIFARMEELGSILFLVDEMAIVDGRIQKGGRGGVKMLETLLG